MQEIGTAESYPGANITNDDDIAASIRKFATSTWSHPSGSLSMMKREYGGVVDSKLRVYGVNRLRVVDASIMPLIPGTHTSSTVYAVAEKVDPFYVVFKVGSMLTWLFSFLCYRRRILLKPRIEKDIEIASIIDKTRNLLSSTLYLRMLMKTKTHGKTKLYIY